MANNSTGNMIFCSAVNTSYAIKNIRVLGILVHCTHAADAAIIELGAENSARTYPTVIKFEVPAASDYAHLDFSDSPLIFPDGIRVKTLTNCEITFIFERNIQNGG